MTHLHSHDDPAHCQALLEQLNEYLDGQLGAELCRDLEHHLAGCRDCQVVFDTLGKTIRLYHMLDARVQELPPDVEQRLLQRLHAP
ncbi:MAG TPA: zf-HC2 domain-containing protein [Roseiflexaceae bacterium]|nr:zf-HC2 domain-containing protein [Roseiflexaceae bacterium]